MELNFVRRKKQTDACITLLKSSKNQKIVWNSTDKTLLVPLLEPQLGNIRDRAAEVQKFIDLFDWSCVAIEASSAQPELVQVLEGLVMCCSLGAWYNGSKASATKVLTVILGANSIDKKGFEHIKALAASVTQCRNLVHCPPNLQGPKELASQIVAKLKPGTSKVYKLKDLRKSGMNLVLAVGAAGRSPVMLHAWHKPEVKHASKLPTVTLVGKGVIFDAGGLDLKNPAGMLRMKYDMSGAAAVAAVLQYCQLVNLPIELDIVIPAVENLVATQAMRPGDVYTAYNGTTVEITNTDAEGRLILADALSWAGRQIGSQITVDVATLTGAATITAGWNPVALCNNKILASKYATAAHSCDEKTVFLPLWPEYERELASDVADMKNATNTRNAGTIAAAAFLSHFVDSSWLHVDIAASAWTNSPIGYLPKGPSASAVRSLIYFLTSLTQTDAALISESGNGTMD